MLPHLQITNVSDGDIISHSLVILQGNIRRNLSSSQSINDEVSVSCNNSLPQFWPLLNDKFKTVVKLRTGSNIISLKFNDIEKDIKLYHRPSENPKLVRLVYIMCSDGDGSYQSPQEDNNLEIAIQKVSLAASLVQAVMGEKLRDHGLQRKCFRLEENEDGEAVCHTFTSKLKTREMHSMTSEELWSHFANELMSSSLNQGSQCKFLAFLSGTSYICHSEIPSNHSEVLANTKGHVALGGGGLALFGTGCLYTWASSLDDLQERLLDDRKVDRLKFMDDSCNRGTFWACYSSGLGATLHELLHTFDLGHSKKGIMASGFHEFQRELIETNRDNCCMCVHKIQSPICNLNWDFKINPPKASSRREILPKQKCLNCGDGAFLLRSQALMLFYHKWFQNSSITCDNMSLPTFKRDQIRWFSGIKVIEIRTLEGLLLHHLEFLDKLTYELDLKLIIESIPTLNRIVNFVIMDMFGNISKVDVNTMTYSVVLR